MSSKNLLHLIVVGLASVGCSSGNPAVSPAKGVVTYKGKPVGGAKVSFVLQGHAPRIGEGTTDSEGRFQISTFANNDGALIGTHDVFITKTPPFSTTTMQAPRTPEEGAKMMAEIMAKQGKEEEERRKKKGGQKSTTSDSEIPLKYGNAQTSGLKAIVSKGASTNDFKFDLVD